MNKNRLIVEHWMVYTRFCIDKNELEAQLARIAAVFLEKGRTVHQEICAIITDRLTQLNQENLGESNVELRQAPPERTA